MLLSDKADFSFDFGSSRVGLHIYIFSKSPRTAHNVIKQDRTVKER